MPGSYTDVQELLPCVLAMKEEGYTYPQIANQFGLAKEQIEELCSRKQRKQRRIEKRLYFSTQEPPEKDASHTGAVADRRIYPFLQLSTH